MQTVIDDNLVPFESDVVAFIRQCVEGLEYLHQRKIAHLDIKVRARGEKRMSELLVVAVGSGVSGFESRATKYTALP